MTSDESDNSEHQPQRSWLDKINHFLHPEPQNLAELLKFLEDSAADKIIDAEALKMIEGVIEVSAMQVRDIMVPRSHMIVVNAEAELSNLIPTIKSSGHSRFPVIGETKDEVLGILLAKDLIDLDSNDETFSLKDILRPPYFVPESKRLDVLLREFRQNSNHMAIVADEYGGVAGLVTIEDILEEIVGDIIDEHDSDEEVNIKKLTKHTFLVRGLTTVEEFNDYFDTQLSDEDFDTIGGLVTQILGHLPKQGESVIIEQLRFKIMQADSRRICLLEVYRESIEN